MTIYFIIFIILLCVISVFDQAHHPTIWPESGSVQDAKGLSWNQGEVEPLEQLGHYHFSLHL